jgi:3-oxoacyl-[acyl-carrier-protein] synthase II
MSRRRVVITGLGVVSPVGCGVATFRESLLAGVSGVGPITLFDPGSLPTRIAAEVREPLAQLVARAGVPLGEAPWALRDRKVIFALEAARQAVEQASRAGAPGSSGGAPGGVSVGVGLELFSMHDLAAMKAPGFRPLPTLAGRLGFLQTPSDLCVPLLARRHGLHGAPLVHVSACAAGADAIGAAFRRVASGAWGWALAGGTDSMINPLGVAGFCRLGATSTRNGEPERASRPFDRRRDGFVLGEGSGMLVLEPLESALARGAEVLGEVIGYGNSFDALGISEPHPEGRGAHAAMRRAVRDAGVELSEIGCVNAHGTSTPKNDPVETLAIRRLFGAQAVPVVATKSMIGHCISAAGSIEAVAAVACMNTGWVHPTLNLDDPDPLCDLDHVPHRARRHEHDVVLSSSFAFGGQNAALVLGSARRALSGR